MCVFQDLQLSVRVFDLICVSIPMHCSLDGRAVGASILSHSMHGSQLARWTRRWRVNLFVFVALLAARSMDAPLARQFFRSQCTARFARRTRRWRINLFVFVALLASRSMDAPLARQFFSSQCTARFSRRTRRSRVNLFVFVARLATRSMHAPLARQSFRFRCTAQSAAFGRSRPSRASPPFPFL